MITRRSLLSLLLTAVALAVGSARAAEPVRPFVSTVPTNIFSAVQPRPIGPIRVEGPTGPIITRYPAPTLTGVVIDDKDYVAMLEWNGRVALVRVGFAIPQPAVRFADWPLKNQGTIAEINLFYIMIKPADGSPLRRVDVGKNIADDTLVESIGRVTAASTVPDPAVTPAPLSAKPVEAPVTDPNEDPVIAAMKAKRAAALGTTPPPQP